MTDAQANEIVRNLVNSAREILQDDPTLLDDFGGFARCMWDDDGERERAGISADEYGYLVREAYRALIRGFTP